MDLRPEEHDALNRLHRHGVLPLGAGPDAIPADHAIRLSLGGFVQLTLKVGEQRAEITPQGRAFRNRVVR